jgi:hypothetical protein
MTKYLGKVHRSFAARRKPAKLDHNRSRPACELSRNRRFKREMERGYEMTFSWKPMRQKQQKSPQCVEHSGER